MPNSRVMVPVSKVTLQAFKDQSDAIIQDVVARALTIRELVAGHGERAEQVFSAGLQTAIVLHNTALLDWQMNWANSRLRHNGVLPEHILAHLEIYAEVVAQRLPAEQAQAINQFVEYMIDVQRALIAASGQA